MTAREYCNLYDYQPDRKIAWPKSRVGLIFTKYDGFGRSVRHKFLPKEQCVTYLDLCRFVTKYNIENWVIEGTDERPYIATTYAENHGRVLYRFTVAQN